MDSVIDLQPQALYQCADIRALLRSPTDLVDEDREDGNDGQAENLRKRSLETPAKCARLTRWQRRALPDRAAWRGCSLARSLGRSARSRKPDHPPVAA